MRTSRGFTLIELLVVIVIIIVLMGIVLVALSNARYTGEDAAVKGDLASIQVQASQYYSSKIPGTFGTRATTCAAAASVFGDTASPVYKTVSAAIAHATENTKNNALICRSSCVDATGATDNSKCAASQSNAYLVAGQLSNGKYWCVDSRQAAREVAPVAGAFPSGNLCPSS